jgi:MoxR-like ATPase
VPDPWTSWRIILDASETERRERWRYLPPPRMATKRMGDPAHYIADSLLIDAIHTAVLLGQPLLITGEPGCGKTEVANFVTYQFGLERKGQEADNVEYAMRFDVKSTTRAQDLFYSFDTVGRFHASRQDGVEAIDPKRFITFHALGRAVLDASPANRVIDLYGRNYIRNRSTEPRRSVVLIDEIDKAPRDVPNDLLMEIEQMAFYIAELDLTIEADRACSPIVILTSNSERALPDAFLRRCVFFSMPFPPAERLREIVCRRIPEFPSEAGLLNDVLGLFAAIRDLRLRKRPGLAELLGFLNSLLGLGFDPAKRLHEQDDKWEGIARTTLLKSTEDHEEVTDEALADLAHARPDT